MIHWATMSQGKNAVNANVGEQNDHTCKQSGSVIDAMGVAEAVTW